MPNHPDWYDRWGHAGIGWGIVVLGLVVPVVAHFWRG